jgi:hypothetical protein
MTAPDGVIAAIAQIKGGRLAPRNLADFETTGLELICPWDFWGSGVGRVSDEAGQEIYGRLHDDLASLYVFDERSSGPSGRPLRPKDIGEGDSCSKSGPPP